jgi:hypothetical protein
MLLGNTRKMMTMPAHVTLPGLMGIRISAPYPFSYVGLAACEGEPAAKLHGLYPTASGFCDQKLNIFDFRRAPAGWYDRQPL